MVATRFRLQHTHSFQRGELLIRPVGPGRVSQFMVDEVISPYKVRIVRVRPDGSPFGRPETISGPELKHYARDRVANHLLQLALSSQAEQKRAV